MRAAFESAGTDGDAAPLIQKNFPPHCRRRRQKIPGMSDRDWTQPCPDRSNENAGHVATAGEDEVN
jgi:hypothetical protein